MWKKKNHINVIQVHFNNEQIFRYYQTMENIFHIDSLKGEYKTLNNKKNQLRRTLNLPQIRMSKGGFGTLVIIKLSPSGPNMQPSLSSTNFSHKASVSFSLC
jgi:hypothetical protein